jgi:hypothetical protein
VKSESVRGFFFKQAADAAAWLQTAYVFLAGQTQNIKMFPFSHSEEWFD